MNFLVKTKNEYTIQLINILSTHIYEGLESIYNEYKKIIKKGEERKLLKAFQQFIKRIPNWNSNLIDCETMRIKTSSRCDFLEDLLKAVVKANIILLSNNNSGLDASNIEENYLNISLSKFIHRCYVECARQFYNAPYLFYHEVKPIERKRNQRDCNDIIKQSIKEAIRKMLPVQHILSQYLGNNLLFGNQEVDKPISNIDSENLKQLLSRDLGKNPKIKNPDLVESEINIVSDKSFKVSYNNSNDNNDSNDSNDSEGETTKLLEEMKKSILTNNIFENINNSDNNSDNSSNKQQSIPIKIYYSDNKNQLNEEILQTENEIKKSLSENEIKYVESENEIKNIVLNEQKNNNIDSESSIPYIGNDDEYEDVFSNLQDSINSEIKTIKNSINSEINKEKRKGIYFSKFNGL